MYHSFDKKDIGDQSPEEAYASGYVFTREHKGSLNQTRSVRITLSDFELSSENRRILKKTEGLTMQTQSLPLSGYEWSVGKLAKDFYDTKAGPNTFSANKVKELLTTDHNFNTLLTYTEADAATPIGYAICFESDTILHYSYPFYDLEHAPKDTGMGMMLRSIEYAKENDKEYIYLGSLTRPGDTYKLQFKGLEWFDGEKWSSDIEKAKEEV